MPRPPRVSSLGPRPRTAVSGLLASLAATLAAALVLLAILPASAQAEAGAICKVCGRPIEGEAIRVGADSYHPACYRDRLQVRCDYCRRPIDGDYVVKDGHRYHQECWEQHVALHCSICGGVLQGHFLKDFWGNRYHKSHLKELPQCDYCKRLISAQVTGGGVRYPDGRDVCNICRKTAVDDPRAARPLLSEAASRLAEIGLAVDPSRVRLRLVDRTEMARFGETAGGDRTGFTSYRSERTEDGGRISEEIDVYLLAGMPRLDALATLAHELTHVWLSTHDHAEIALPFKEGSCNAAAILVLRSHPGRETDWVVENLRGSDDPVYGEGTRRVLRYLDERGEAAWVRLLRDRYDFPSGF